MGCFRTGYPANSTASVVLLPFQPSHWMPQIAVQCVGAVVETHHEGQALVGSMEVVNPLGDDASHRCGTQSANQTYPSPGFGCGRPPVGTSAWVPFAGSSEGVRSPLP